MESRGVAALRQAMVLASLLVLDACKSPPPSDPSQQLIDRGGELFFNETFAGNGRTCGTCHPRENNFALDPAFIATLPADDALFVAEFNADLKSNFENPRLMREFALILENLDGFDDLPSRFVMRGVPHVLGLRNTVASAQGPRTGWSGDGAPGDRSLRSFATGAVIQHFTSTLNRVPGVDFRLPTPEELDALEAFMLSLGRQEELDLPLPLKGAATRRGQEIFLDDALGKCNVCHANAGANVGFGGGSAGNANFNTGVENLPDQPARLTSERVPVDDGLGTPGDGTFNTPPIVEAADSGPFFHNNAIETIEGAVAFYNGKAFNDSPAGRFLASTDPQGVGIRLDATQVIAVAAFLRVLNALENIRESLALLEDAGRKGVFERRLTRELLERASVQTNDGIQVLSDAGLHPLAVVQLELAQAQIEKSRRSAFRRSELIRSAIDAHRKARVELVETP
jgi:mono/diheme cytochrome c family protein